MTVFFYSEEVILNEERTTEEERRYIMEARKRAMQKRKKLRTLGKSRSTESEDEENEEEEGEKQSYGRSSIKCLQSKLFKKSQNWRKIATVTIFCSEKLSLPFFNTKKISSGDIYHKINRHFLAFLKKLLTINQTLQ